MTILTESYEEQRQLWPRTGRHILAHFSDETVVVYQAYRPSISRFAVMNGYFGGADFSYRRMSWIKPNFLWMMYRSGWATRPGQETIVAIHLHRRFFDDLLARAVPSTHRIGSLFSDKPTWQLAVSRSDVRLQWDPDHHPSGAPVERRALQLGLRGEALEGFRGAGIAHVEDVTPLVEEQRHLLETGGDLRALQTPRERLYPVVESATRQRLGLSEG